MPYYGQLSTSKTSQETRGDINHIFERWGIDEFRIFGPETRGSQWGTARLEFWTNDKKQVLSCDRFPEYRVNLRALYLILEALRKADERGILPDLARAARAMLPPGAMKRPPHEVLGVAPDTDIEVAEAAYKTLAKKRHPDAGGNHEDMRELNEAWDEFKAARATEAR